MAEDQVDECFLQLRDSPGFEPGSLLILGTVVPGTDNWRQIYDNAEEYWSDFAAGRNDWCIFNQVHHMQLIQRRKNPLLMLKILWSGILLVILCPILLLSRLAAQENKKNLLLLGHQTMSDRWELQAPYHKGIFVITPYKPVFVTAGRRSDKPNTLPTSENPMYTQPTPIEYNNYEAKFQFSLKTKVLYGLFGNRADLWVGYTQKAHWQIYNTELSRPFRELNYEPELILNFPLNLQLGSANLRMAGIAFNHQSNGRSLPLSRSWNRLIAHAAFDSKNMQLILRGWYRLKDEDDENPLITDYVGRGEGVFVYNIKRHQLSVIAGSACDLHGRGAGACR